MGQYRATDSGGPVIVGSFSKLLPIHDMHDFGGHSSSMIKSVDVSTTAK